MLLEITWYILHLVCTHSDALFVGSWLTLHGNKNILLKRPVKYWKQLFQFLFLSYPACPVPFEENYTEQRAN